MTNLIASSEIDAVIGLGATGLSVARFLQRENRQFVMLDTRDAPPQLQHFRQRFPRTRVELGALSVDTLLRASRVIVSPGLSTASEPFDQVRAAKIRLIGDIQLFVEAATAPVIAITGSNAKSTVTTLVGQMAAEAGRAVGVGGNLGTPALDLLEQVANADYYVLELSSFQLETTERLDATVAAVLNISHDHMDRYPSLQAYHAAKQRIYLGAKKIVVNRHDMLTYPPLRDDSDLISFGLDRPDLKDFGLIKEGDDEWLAHGLHRLMPVSALKIAGRHNVANALAALAIGHAAGLPTDAMLATLRRFSGLPHRCQWLANINGVDFYNDSKGTNVGATLAAIGGLARAPHKVVLIAGGEGKGADFNPLLDAFRNHLRATVVIGRDADRLADIANRAGVTVLRATTMEDAVSQAAAAAQPGDAVLLSPACASFDMFDNYEHRGRAFGDAVKTLH